MTPGYVPPKKSRGWLWFTIGIVTIILACLGGLGACALLVGGTAAEFDKQQRAMADDVKIINCDFSDSGNSLIPNVEVMLEVTNGSDNQLTYLIDVFVFDDKGNRIGNSTAVVSDVRPDQVVKESSTVILSEPVTGTITCKVDKVS